VRIAAFLIALIVLAGPAFAQGTAIDASAALNSFYGPAAPQDAAQAALPILGEARMSTAVEIAVLLTSSRSCRPC
jgi:hypothetical protein